MKRILIIAACVTGSLLLAGTLLDSSYKKYWWPFFDKLDVAIKDSAYYDGIYLGDSRVHFGINPYYVDSVTGMQSYNLGMGGAPINEIHFLATAYLQKHRSPRFAVLSVGHSNLLEPGRFFENPCYYFFYLSDTATNRVLEELRYHTSLYKILPASKYTAFDDFNKFSIAESWKGNTIVKKGGVVYRGFINNTSNAFNAANMEKETAGDTACYAGIQTLEATLRLFQQKKTLPVLVYPPATYQGKPAKTATAARIDSAIAILASRYNIPVLHFDNDSSFSHDLFTDPWHLNIRGTILYSQKMGAAIKAILDHTAVAK